MVPPVLLVRQKGAMFPHGPTFWVVCHCTTLNRYKAVMTKWYLGGKGKSRVSLGVLLWLVGSVDLLDDAAGGCGDDLHGSL